jgi:hypothetical protein
MQRAARPWIRPGTARCARPAVRLAVEIGLPAVALLVERQGMAIDPAATRIPEHKARRPFVVARLELRERSARTIEVLHGHRKVEVVVLPRLLLEQRVDPPSALETEPDAGGVPPVEDLRRIACAHGHGLEPR